MRKLITALIIGLLLSGCAVSPEGRHQLTLLPAKQMNALGAQGFEQIKASTPISTDPAIVSYVNCIARRIIMQLEKNNNPDNWEVVVFNDPQANAFALPGNKIGVYTGLLKYARNQHQLAAVIGHEVGHVIARHSNERLSSKLAVSAGLTLAAAVLGSDRNNDSLLMAGLGLGAQYGLILPFSRKHESEADVIGLDLMAEAGFDPSQSIPLWQNMAQAGVSPPEFMSTHPSSDTRIRNLRARLPKALKLRQQALLNSNQPDCVR